MFEPACQVHTLKSASTGPCGRWLSTNSDHKGGFGCVKMGAWHAASMATLEGC